MRWSLRKAALWVAVALATASLISCSIGPATGKRHYYAPSITEVRETQGSPAQLELSYQVLVESLYYCPGVYAAETAQGVELTFPRFHINRKPKADFPSELVRRETGTWWVVTIPKPKGAVFVRHGNESSKIYPLP